jgi:hypothetical protein
MRDLTRGGARTIIEAAEAREIARLARPDDPDLIERGEIESALGDSSLILDGLRRRPRWFDGRFLTGADLTRDQDYARQRQPTSRAPRAPAWSRGSRSRPPATRAAPRS